MDSRRVGVIVEVNNQISKVGIYSLINDDNVIWNGEFLSGIKVGAYLTINQNYVKIIATVTSEKIFDQQNSAKSEEFDNTFHKNTIYRIVELQTKGVIVNNKFTVTSKYTPMVGNEVTLTTNEELNQIYGIRKNEETVTIGKTILEEYPVRIPINRFFASHIGIFGNTGSGKSNTLHKLYLELFKSNFKDRIKNKSKFFLIDFNGEYCEDNMFNLKPIDKIIYNINTRSKQSDKIKIKKDFLFDADILSIIFDARPATQVPFLKKAVNVFNGLQDENSFIKLERGLLIKILKLIKKNDTSLLDQWLDLVEKAKVNKDYLLPIRQIKFFIKDGAQYEKYNQNINIIENDDFNIVANEDLKIDFIFQDLKEIYQKSDYFNKFSLFLEFERIFTLLFNSSKADYINPLFSRVRIAINALDNVIDVVENSATDIFRTMNIINLVNANSDVKRLIPMLLSKMVYDDHKKEVSNGNINSSVHLIIDEAHNILNSQHKNIGDDWQDYRLNVFEEIIKEGRKFGFYLTLASQRPADISPTIMSQLHNYIIHRLVNDRDLEMIANTMPTIDLASYKRIPLLGQGEAIITGTALDIPIITKVDHEETTRPKSDDLKLTELWKN